MEVEESEEQKTLKREASPDSPYYLGNKEIGQEPEVAMKSRHGF